MILALLLAANSPLPPQLGPAWGEFSRSPALQRTRTTVEIGTLGSDRRGGPLQYWLRRTVVERWVETVSWTDTRRCAAVRPALRAMAELAPPRFAPPGMGPAGPIVMDGVGYRLRAPSQYGGIAIDSNVGTPLAQWVDSTLGALRSCWTTKVPERARR